MDAKEKLDVTASLLAKGEAEPNYALPVHDKDYLVSIDPNPKAVFGEAAVSAGFSGVGKLMAVNPSLCPHDAMGGSSITDGTDACDAIPLLSC